MNNTTLMRPQKITVYSEKLEDFQLSVVTNIFDPDKQTLLLLHGYLGSLRDYDPFYAKFSSVFNIVAIDLRGHGKSDSPEGDWTMNDLVNDVYQIVRLLIPDNHKLIIVGNSLSTAITLTFASKYPELIQKIFLISPTSKFSLPLLRRFVIKWMGITPNKLLSSSLKLVDKLLLSTLRSKSRKESVKMAMQKITHIPINVHKKILQVTLPSYQVSAEELHVPMMIVAGEDDDLVPFEDSVVLNSTARNSSILMLKNTKHHILVKRTELVIDIFDQWIRTPAELLTDVEHYHEKDLIADIDGHLLLPEDWVTSECELGH